MADLICIICNSEIQESQNKRTLKAGGIKTLVQASIKRKDGKHKQMQDLTSITLHDSCSVMYKRESSIAAAAARTSTSTSRRSSKQVSFDFSANCFFCGEDASADYIERQKVTKAAYRKPVSFVKTADFRNNIIELLKKRSDKYSNDIYLRLVEEQDISSKNARYHRHCYKNFFKFREHSIDGRPINDKHYEAVQLVIDYLNNHNSECQFSLLDVLDDIVKDYKDPLPEIRYILRHLQDYFGDDIIIHTSKRDTILSFRNIGEKLLSESWYANRLADTDSERERIVKTAALIILDDIRSKVYDKSYYPAPNCFLENIDEDIPNTLKQFLDILIKTNKCTKGNNGEKLNNRVNYMSHSIISSVRPRKHGLHCSDICQNCHGQFCANVEEIHAEEDIFQNNIELEVDEEVEQEVQPKKKIKKV